jgi:NTP pyrophosphatase (non-canonical NTP hydrolase)
MENTKEIFEKAIEVWGVRSQLEMAQEESTELALAIRKFIRQQNDEKFDDMIGEIADVEIMISQLKLMFPAIQEKVDTMKSFKINRLKERIIEATRLSDEVE